MLFFWPTGSSRVRGVCLAYALAMSLTLVYTAEHYVADVIAGWAYAAAAYLLVDRASAARRARRERRDAAAGPGQPALRAGSHRPRSGEQLGCT